MNDFFQIAALCIIGALLASFLRKERPEFSFCIGGVAIALSAYAAFSLLSPVVSFLTQLQKTADISETAIAPVLKTVAIGLLTEVAGAVCADAGELSLAKVTEISGLAAALYCALPLAEAVLQLVQSLLGG